MKKLLSLILIFAMTFCACVSFAEEGPDTKVTPAFSLSMTLPEGYTATETWPDPYVVNVMLENEDPSKPLIGVQISYEDIYSDVTFSRDVWENEEIQNHAASLAYDVETEQYDEYFTRDTGLGTVIMIIHEADYTRMLTIWHGYMVTLFAADKAENGGAVPVSDETLEVIMKFLTDMDISKVIVENAV
ncbi:MAG: hypothetical protein IKI84_08200 [Clostridia bacterium]|nr:hypothetical protein [Clostridia bacterium]